MLNLGKLFGKSPFEPMVDHARKVHACVALIRPITEAILAQEMDKLLELQHQTSKTEYEADLLKDGIRQNLSGRYFLPVNREDMGRYLSQVDRIADFAEDFAVVATFRTLQVPAALHQPFREFADKVIQISECLLSLAEHLAELQQESFAGPDSDDVLRKIQEVCHMEWESDKLSRKFARLYYSAPELDPVVVMLLEKLCRGLSGIADSAENVGKHLRLMIQRD